MVLLEGRDPAAEVIAEDHGAGQPLGPQAGETVEDRVVHVTQLHRCLPACCLCWRSRGEPEAGVVGDGGVEPIGLPVVLLLVQHAADVVVHRLVAQLEVAATDLRRREH